jgi:hypothetical protein
MQKRYLEVALDVMDCEASDPHSFHGVNNREATPLGFRAT